MVLDVVELHSLDGGGSAFAAEICTVDSNIQVSAGAGQESESQRAPDSWGVLEVELEVGLGGHALH